LPFQCPQTGHRHDSGISSSFIPGGSSALKSPFSASKAKLPQNPHTNFKNKHSTSYSDRSRYSLFNPNFIVSKKLLQPTVSRLTANVQALEKVF